MIETSKHRDVEGLKLLFDLLDGFVHRMKTFIHEKVVIGGSCIQLIVESSCDFPGKVVKSTLSLLAIKVTYTSSEASVKRLR